MDQNQLCGEDAGRPYACRDVAFYDYFLYLRLLNMT